MFGVCGWGATSPERGTNKTRPLNARSVAVWGTRLEMLREGSFYLKLQAFGLYIFCLPVQ
jgi:hypothetical protein